MQFYLGEDFPEGVGPVLTLKASVVEDISAESGELVAQEEVGEEDLDDAVDEGKNLTTEKPDENTAITL